MIRWTLFALSGLFPTTSRHLAMTVFLLRVTVLSPLDVWSWRMFSRALRDDLHLPMAWAPEKYSLFQEANEAMAARDAEERRRLSAPMYARFEALMVELHPHLVEAGDPS